MDLKVCQGVCGLCLNLAALSSKCLRQLLTEKAHLEGCTRAKYCTSFCAYRIKILKIINVTGLSSLTKTKRGGKKCIKIQKQRKI